ncbi:hypothetical protein ACRB68_44430 [Actinomadura sp. RB68]|uniref:DUF11 domain-containing protein n=2 Tax=Actinomadura macrotermitis TaxID=2585200 RepID=A0A7K0BYU7_9ACTN|nr:hypothetical protein [Actinomadura macrotermitis]
MKGIVTAAGAAVIALGAAPPAWAEGTGKVEFVYSMPKVSAAGDTVTWTWTLRNTGTRDLDRVTLEHRLTPRLRVTSVSARCKPAKASVRCEYGAVRVGGRRTGFLVAALPPSGAGDVRINGRATWEQAPPAAAPRPRRTP